MHIIPIDAYTYTNTREGHTLSIQYRHTLSKTSSSGSSYERQPSAEPSSEELLSQLKTRHDEEVTRLTERPSVVEAERDRVTREKEKWRV